MISETNYALFRKYLVRNGTIEIRFESQINQSARTPASWPLFGIQDTWGERILLMVRETVNFDNATSLYKYEYLNCDLYLYFGCQKHGSI